MRIIALAARSVYSRYWLGRAIIHYCMDIRQAVCGHGLALPGPPNYDSPAGRIGAYGLGSFKDELRKVVVFVVLGIAAINRLVPEGLQMLDQCFFEFEPGVVGCEINFHAFKYRLLLPSQQQKLTRGRVRM